MLPLWQPINVGLHRNKFHHVVLALRGLLWGAAALFAWGHFGDGIIWAAVFFLALVGLLFWRKPKTMVAINQFFILLDLGFIGAAIAINGGMASQAYLLYGGEALFRAAYGTLCYSALGVTAVIISYGFATAAWDMRLFWWRNIILGLYFLGAGALGEQFWRSRSRDEENQVILRQMMRLRALQESIVEVQDIDTVLKQLLAEARETTNSDIGFLARINTAQRIETVITDGQELPEFDYSSVPIPDSLLLVMEDSIQDWDHPLGRRLAALGMKSAALMPLRREEFVYGWMGLASLQNSAEISSQEMVIRSLADMMSIQLKFHVSQMVAAKRGNLLAILERVGRIVNRNLEMDQLLRSLRQAVADVLELDSFFVALTLPDDPKHAFLQYLWDDGEEYPQEIIPLDPNGLTGSVIATGKARLLGEDTTTGTLAGSNKAPRGILLVPLIHEGRVLGAMSAQSYRIEYDPDHLEFLSAIASQASIAIRNAQMYQQTQEIALTDYLTGMGNSRRFNLVLQSVLEVAEESGQPLSLLLIDSDSLKSINDRFGHRAGDLHLQRLAQVIRENVRDIDMAFRYAGDEFVIILAKTAIADAAQIGERIRHQIEVHRFQWSDARLGSTISVGVARHRPGMTADELFQAADHAMYEAKQSGKNRVAWAQ